MPPVQEPVVEPLLRAAACNEGIFSFGLADESFSLAAFDSLGQECLAALIYLGFGLCEPGRKDYGAPFGRMGFFQAG
jgi:hypothetical protein